MCLRQKSSYFVLAEHLGNMHYTAISVMFGSFMISETSKFLAAITELAALQFQYGVIWAELIAGGLM